MTELLLTFDDGKRKSFVEFSFPSCWDELRLDHVLLFAAKLKELKASVQFGIPTHEFKLKMLMRLLDINRYNIFSAKRNLFYKLNAEQLFNLVEATDFLYKSCDLTRNPLPTLSYRLKKFIGPSDGLKNLSGSEFAFADTMYSRYCKTKDERFLSELIAILYREKDTQANEEERKKRNDDRIPFVQYSISERLKLAESLSEGQRQAIFLFYTGSREAMILLHEIVFNDEDNKQKAEDENLGWGAVLIELSGTKFGDLKQTGQENIWNIMLYLKMLAIKDKKQKEQLEEIKNKR